MFFGVVFAVWAFALSGCGTTRVAVHSIQPAEAKGVAQGAKIAVKGVGGDRSGDFSEMLRSMLGEKSYQGAPYLKMVPSSEARFIVSGNVREDSARSFYDFYRTRCAAFDLSGYCLVYERNRDVCRVDDATVHADLSLVDASTQEVVFSRPYSKRVSLDSCRIPAGHAPLGEFEASDLAFRDVASQFADSLAPTRYEMRVMVFDDWKYDFDSKQEDRFESSIKYIRQGRFDQAKKILEDLDASVGGKSYEVAYNLGVLNESKGNLHTARSLYKRADSLLEKPNPAVSEGLTRVENSIRETEEAKVQSGK